MKITLARRALLVAAAAAAMTLGVAQAASAQATTVTTASAHTTTATPAGHAATHRTASPQISYGGWTQQVPAVLHEVTLTNYNGHSYSYGCAEGYTYHGGILPGEVQHVVNDCAVRVWLHQYNNNTGVSICTSPFSARYTGSTVPFVNLYISTNSSAC